MEISIAIIFVLDMETRFCFGLYKNIVIWRVRTYRDQGIGTCQLNNLNQFLKKRGGRVSNHRNNRHTEFS